MKASIIIPSYNKANKLNLLLESLTRQSYSRDDFEIIVVDDGSTDQTKQILSEYQSKFSMHSIFNDHQGQAMARNRGLACASGETILLCDADIIVSRDWIKSHLNIHDSCSDCVVIGSMGEICPFLPFWCPPQFAYFVIKKARYGNHFACRVFYFLMKMPGMKCRISHAAFDQDFDRIASEAITYHNTTIARRYGENLDGLYIPWILFLTGNVSVSRERLLHAGGFHSNFKGWGLEDVELGYRLHNEGAKFKFSPHAISYHQAHSRNWKTQDMELRANYEHFYKLHPSESVRLHWNYICGHISLEEYNERTLANA